ncbi:MAG: transporter [Actinomycetia bacterium]|nr:transporter [Actinomycetes bacterium]
MPAGAFEAFRSDLGLTYAQASMVLAAAAPGAIAGNVFAVAADYVSRRLLASAGAFGYAIALGLFATAHSFTTVVVASFLVGMSATAMIDAAEVALVDLVGDDLGPTLARANFLGAIGDLLGPLAVVVAAGLGFGWRAPFVVAALVMAAYAVWLATLPLPAPRDRSHPDAPERPLRALLDVARDRRVWFFAALATLLGPLDEPFLAFLIAFAERHRSMSASGAVALAMCSVVGSVVGFGLRAVRRTGPTGTLTRPAVVMACAAAALVVVPWVPGLVVAAFAFGAALAAFWNTADARILSLRPGQAGTVKAVITTLEFGAFGLPIAYGAVADARGMTAGLACYAATAILLAVLVTRAPDDRATSRPVTRPTEPQPSV